MRIKLFIANKIYDVKRGGPALSFTMTLIFPKIVWTCPLRGWGDLFNQFHIIFMSQDGLQNGGIMNINEISNVFISLVAIFFFLVYSVAVPQNQSQ